MQEFILHPERNKAHETIAYSCFFTQLVIEPKNKGHQQGSETEWDQGDKERNMGGQIGIHRVVYPIDRCGVPHKTGHKSQPKYLAAFPGKISTDNFFNSNEQRDKAYKQ